MMKNETRHSSVKIQKLHPIDELTKSNNCLKPSLTHVRHKHSQSLKKLNQSTKRLMNLCKVKRRGFERSRGSRNRRPKELILLEKRFHSESSISVDSFVMEPKEQFKLLVLVINSTSRYFEILSCLVDKRVSTVENLLEVVDETAGDNLKNVNFTGILNLFGEEFEPASIIGECTNGKELLIASFDFITASECLEYARPILKHPKLLSMMKLQDIMEITPTGYRPTGKIKNVNTESISHDSTSISWTGKDNTISNENFGPNGIHKILCIPVLVFIISIYVSFSGTP